MNELFFCSNGVPFKELKILTLALLAAAIFLFLLAKYCDTLLIEPPTKLLYGESSVESLIFSSNFESSPSYILLLFPILLFSYCAMNSAEATIEKSCASSIEITFCPDAISSCSYDDTASIF